MTIKEVARRAGVSTATVSRVLNEKGPIRDETRQRVRRAVDRLRYVPHGAARSLITRRTSTVGVILPDIYGEFFSEVIRGIDLAARKSGYHILVTGSHSDRRESEAVLRALRGRVDGMIIMSPDIDAEALEANLPETLPVVLLNTAVRNGAWAALGIDNRGAAASVIRHLAGLGHRRIAIVTGPWRNHDARERLEGARRAIRELSLDDSPELEIEGDFSQESGYRAGRRILELSPRPTAIFAANDSMAIGCLSALRGAGVQVPRDIALVGFDDIPTARFLTPPLTTVRVAIAPLGERAMLKLLGALSSRPGRRPRRETLPTTLMVRGSCGSAPFPETNEVRTD
ncbi:MAG TPA: LacI family DNA-binding transcriptional regulator, partial [Vicinamibacteria bacterium]